jgi:hypothetical protein
MTGVYDWRMALRRERRHSRVCFPGADLFLRRVHDVIPYESGPIARMRVGAGPAMMLTLELQ